MGLWSSPGCTGVEMLLQARSHDVGRVQLISGCWTGGLSSLLADGQRLLSIPCHVDLSIGLLIT